MTLTTANGHDFLVDDEDARLVSKYRWYAYQGRRPDHFKILAAKGVVLARLLLSAPTDMCVDHISGNTLDNRKSNLRLATKMQNLQNRATASHNTSGYKGVEKHHGTYRAVITANKKTHRLFGFKTPEEAARAYNDMALKYHGEFARLNVI